jgi:hypothetical protein
MAMTTSIVDWIIFWVFGIVSLFISAHSISTPTPEEDEEYQKTHYVLNPLHPGPMTQAYREQRTRYTKRLRRTGWIGLVLTLGISIVTLLPFMPEVLFGQLYKQDLASFVFLMVLFLQFYVEKRTT